MDSSGWNIIRTELIQQIRIMSRQLIETEDLSEGKRLGLVVAVRELKRGITIVYEKAGREIPSHIRQELDFYRDED